MEFQCTEYYGSLIKEEELVLVQDAILPNTFVLEAVDPFPGYYESFPKTSRPLYVYLVLKNSCSLEDVYRASQNIKKYFPESFSATICKIIFQEEICAIRIRQLDNYAIISQLQSCFINEGIEFKRKPDKTIHGKAIIKLQKFYWLQNVEASMFLDLEEPDHGYFLLEKHASWDEFVEVAKKVSFNWAGSKFDAALGLFFNKHSIFDMVRIYHKPMTRDFLNEVRVKYLSEFDRKGVI